MFYTNERNSLNRFKGGGYSFYNLSLYSKTKILNLINKYLISIPLRGEKSYDNFLEFKIIRLPYIEKEYTANEVIDYLLPLILFKKLNKLKIY